MQSRPSVTGDYINYSQQSPKRREEREREALYIFWRNDKRTLHTFSEKSTKPRSATTRKINALSQVYQNHIYKSRNKD